MRAFFNILASTGNSGGTIPPPVNEPSPHLFAEMGQSNMQGKFGDINNPDYPFTSTNGYWFDETERPISTLRGVGDRASTNGCHANYFAEKYFELTGKKAVMLPTAVGGTCLTNIANEQNWGSGTNGTLRGQAKSIIDGALAYYNKTAPKYGLWAQGEGDATYMFLNPDTYTKADVKAAMQELVDWWFSNYTNSPFIISELGIRTNSEPERIAAFDTMRDIHNEIAAENSKVYIGFKQAKDFGSDFPPGIEGIDRSDVGGMGDNVHYNYLGLTLMGKGMATFCANKEAGVNNYTLNGYTYNTL